MQRGDDPERQICGNGAERSDGSGKDGHASPNGRTGGGSCDQPLLSGGLLPHGRVFLRRLAGANVLQLANTSAAIPEAAGLVNGVR